VYRLPAEIAEFDATGMDIAKEALQFDEGSASLGEGMFGTVHLAMWTRGGGGGGAGAGGGGEGGGEGGSGEGGGGEGGGGGGGERVRVAVKEVGDTADGELAKYIRAELSVLRHLPESPFIISYHGCYHAEQDKKIYMVTGLAAGGDLKSHLTMPAAHPGSVAQVGTNPASRPARKPPHALTAVPVALPVALPVACVEDEHADAQPAGADSHAGHVPLARARADAPRH
jgi:hypothetical protein